MNRRSSFRYVCLCTLESLKCYFDSRYPVKFPELYKMEFTIFSAIYRRTPFTRTRIKDFFFYRFKSNFISVQYNTQNWNYVRDKNVPCPRIIRNLIIFGFFGQWVPFKYINSFCELRMDLVVFSSRNVFGV